MGFSVLTLTFKAGFLLFPNLQCQTTAVSNVQQHPPSSCHLLVPHQGGGTCRLQASRPSPAFWGDCHLESWTRGSMLLAICVILHCWGGNYTLYLALGAASVPCLSTMRRSDVFPNVPHTFIAMFFPCICGQFKISAWDHLCRDTAHRRSQLWLQQERP